MPTLHERHILTQFNRINAQFMISFRVCVCIGLDCDTFAGVTFTVVRILETTSFQTRKAQRKRTEIHFRSRRPFNRTDIHFSYTIYRKYFFGSAFKLQRSK